LHRTLKIFSSRPTFYFRFDFDASALSDLPIAFDAVAQEQRVGVDLIVDAPGPRGKPAIEYDVAKDLFRIRKGKCEGCRFWPN
jgi:hypothetical protein